MRAVLSSRKTVLAKCIGFEQEICSLFKLFGIKLPTRRGHGSFKVAPSSDCAEEHDPQYNATNEFYKQELLHSGPDQMDSPEMPEY